MKRLLTMCLAMLVCGMTMASIKKTNLRVLYVGGHSNMETFGERNYDRAANQRSIEERTAAWKRFLEQYFTAVKTVQGKDYNYKMSYDYDVTIIDGDPQPLEERRTLMENGEFSKMVAARYFPDNFDCPVITIADESETVGRRIGVKNDWYCLCLLGRAFNLNKKNAIFKGPYPVKTTMVSRPMPDGAKDFADMMEEKLPSTVKMWTVQNKDYENTHGFKIGMVTRPWGYLDSPDAEVISGGQSAKCFDAIAIGRHANWLHWGFSASPADMTDEAKPVFANAVVYISQFKGHHIIARKLNEGIAIRSDADEQMHRASMAAYESYAQVMKIYNQSVCNMVDSLKKKEAAGETLSDMDRQYMAMADHPQPVPTRTEYLRQTMGNLYDRFGEDQAAYVRYFKENRPYFYGTFKDYDLKLDEDAKALGISNGDKRILDKAISLWENNEDVDMAKRILYRYTLLRYDNPRQWRDWYNQYQRKLFFTESGGWLWLVNDFAPNTPGNDYSVLKVNEIDENTVGQSKAKTTKSDPVVVSSATVMNQDVNELIIRIKIHPGYHIYSVVSDKDPYIQTSYTFKTDGGVKLVGELQKPNGRMFDREGSVVYENEVVLRQNFTGNRGTITCDINYQACDDHACLMPKTKTIKVEL